jgi:hypothetical protein
MRSKEQKQIAQTDVFCSTDANLHHYTTDSAVKKKKFRTRIPWSVVGTDYRLLREGQKEPIETSAELELDGLGVQVGKHAASTQEGTVG